MSAWRCASVRSGSSTADRYIAITGPMADICRSSLDGSHAVFNSHSVNSLELRQSTSYRRSPSHANLPGSSR